MTPDRVVVKKPSDSGKKTQVYGGTTSYVFPCNEECLWEDDFYDIVWEEDNNESLVLLIQILGSSE